MYVCVCVCVCVCQQPATLPNMGLTTWHIAQILEHIIRRSDRGNFEIFSVGEQDRTMSGRGA